METKYFVVNSDNWGKNLPDFSVRIPANWQTEVVGDIARILIRQFEVRMVTFKDWEEIENVSFKDFLDKSNEIKAEEKAIKKSKK